MLSLNWGPLQTSWPSCLTCLKLFIVHIHLLSQFFVWCWLVTKRVSSSHICFGICWAFAWFYHYLFFCSFQSELFDLTVNSLCDQIRYQFMSDVFPLTSVLLLLLFISLISVFFRPIVLRLRQLLCVARYPGHTLTKQVWPLVFSLCYVLSITHTCCCGNF